MRFITGLLGTLLFLAAAQGSVLAVGPGAFPAGSPLLTFDGLAGGTEVNGLVVSGVTFTVTVGGIPANHVVLIETANILLGPTNNITPPVIGGDSGSTLGVTLPIPATLFGYGFTILSTASVANATSISLFMDSTSVGSLSYSGVPDPVLTGGFAGIESTIPFDRAELTFNSVVASAFAADNITYSPVPEPATAPMVLAALALLCTVWRHRPQMLGHRSRR